MSCSLTTPSHLPSTYRKARDAVVPHESVEETEEAVDPVARRASGAGGEAEALALLLQEKAEDTEVLLAGESFAAAEGVECSFACEIVGGQGSCCLQQQNTRFRAPAGPQRKHLKAAGTDQPDGER